MVFVCESEEAKRGRFFDDSGEFGFDQLHQDKRDRVNKE